MDVRSRLVETRVPRDPQGAVLVLHGGGSRGESVPVSPTQLSVLRMVPIAGRIAARARGRLAVFRLLNSARGWDAGHTPVDDVRWALEELEQRFRRALPTALVGHSLGGRAAILASAHEAVRTVVALAPWVYPDDGRIGTAGKQFLVVHGTADRVADPARSLVVAEDLRRSNDVGYVRVTGATHSMLRRHAVFDGLAAQFAVAGLVGGPLPALADRALGAAEPIAV